jgi:hypothetical protein
MSTISTRTMTPMPSNQLSKKENNMTLPIQLTDIRRALIHQDRDNTQLAEVRHILQIYSKEKRTTLGHPLAFKPKIFNQKQV